MKQILIIRHAKSAFKNTGMDDFIRPLNDRWVKATGKMWKFLLENNIVPNIVYCSTAVRARETLEWIRNTWWLHTKIIYDQWLYDHHLTGIKYYLKFLEKIEEQYDFICMIWHNDAFNELVNFLTWNSNIHLPTWAIVLLNSPSKIWSDISKEKIEIWFFEYPKSMNLKKL